MFSNSKNKIFDWFNTQYQDSVGLNILNNLKDNTFSKNFKHFIEEFPTKYEQGGELLQYPITGRIRMENFIFLKFKNSLSIDGYTCCVLNAKIDKASSHYAYLYWKKGLEDLDPEYICISPTYESRDGEYRKRFIKWQIFNKAFNYHTKDLHLFEQTVSKLVIDSLLELNMTFYPADATIIRHYQHSRLPIKIFAYILALDLWEYSTGLLMTHTHPQYIKLISHISRDFPELVEKSRQIQYKEIKNLETEKTQHYITLKFEHSSQTSELQCGQKIVPMFYREVVQFEDYNLSVWRETLIQQHISDLVINFICPSFPIYNQWTYIEDANASLFENSTMEDKYNRGSAMENSITNLREARSKIRTFDEDSHLQNYYTEEFNAHLYEDVEYAQSHLIMSNIALLHTMEDVGWTLYSINEFINKPLVHIPEVVNMFTNSDNAFHYIFNYVYAAHCMHTKMNIVHSDIHSNNLTLYLWAFASEKIHKNKDKVIFKQFYKNPVTVYATGLSDADIYIFPATGINATIIDFSRSIIGPAFRSKLEQNKTPQIATNFYHDQTNRIMRAFNRYAPSFVEKNQEAIKAAVIGNFEMIFPVLCCIDFIAIGGTLIEYFEKTIKELKELKEKTIKELKELKEKTIKENFEKELKLCKKIQDLGQELLITGLSIIIEHITSNDIGKNIGKNTNSTNVEYPGFKMLQLFEKYSFVNLKKSDKLEIVDGYNYNNDVKYSGISYKNFPLWSQLTEIEKNLGSKYIMDDIFEDVEIDNQHNVKNFLQSLNKNIKVSIIAEKLKMENEKKDGNPIYTASSWLDE